MVDDRWRAGTNAARLAAPSSSHDGLFFPQPIPKDLTLARRQSPQTFEKRRRERDKKLKKEAKQQDRIWRNAEKRDAKLQAEDPEAFRKLLEQRRKDEEAWYY